jgi:hypothetical protein
MHRHAAVIRALIMKATVEDLPAWWTPVADEGRRLREIIDA